MEEFKKEITNILVNDDKKRTAVLKRFESYLIRNNKNCNPYTVFIMGVAVGASIMFLFNEILL